MTEPKLYVAGNWKMNGLQADLKEIEFDQGRDHLYRTGCRDLSTRDAFASSGVAG